MADRQWKVYGPWHGGKDVRTFGRQESALGAALGLAQSLPIGGTVWLRWRNEPWVTLHRRPSRKVEAVLHWIAPPGEPDEGATGHIAAMERVAVDALRSKRDGYRSVIQEIADTSEDAATVRFARRALGFDEGER